MSSATLNSYYPSHTFHTLQNIPEIPPSSPEEQLRGQQAINKWRSDSSRGLKNVDLHDAFILVIDDDQVQRTLLLKWLRDAGYKNVTSFTSGTDAWKRMSEDNIKCDLVLTDLMMPGITGATLLEKIRNHPLYHPIPVILMSGEDKTAETAESAIRFGSQDFLFKPLIKQLLIKKISTVLENWMIKEREVAYEMMMKEKEDEIQKLNKEVSILAAENMKVMKAIETPIEGITRTLSKILQDKSLQNLAVKKDLEDVFFTIRTNKDLYAPVIKELLKQEMNPEAKSLLLSCTDVALGRRTSQPTFPVAIREESVAGLKNWDFDVFSYSEKDFPPLVKAMYEDFGLVDRFQIPVANLERFILAVRDGYMANPYHNFVHAFDVLQTVYCLLTTMGAGAFLTHLDIFALLTGALCHDLGHPGLNNAYLINNEADLATVYNDRSVLESHHCASAFKLLKKPELSLLKNLSTDEKKEFRSSFITTVLATDMSGHFSFVAKLEQRIKADKPFDRDNKDDRIMIMETVLKCADISNIAKPWNSSHEWCMRVSNEYFKQGDIERNAAKYPVAEFMDRYKTTGPRTTANFIDLFGIHMFDLLRQVLPPATQCLTLMYENRKKYGEIIVNQTEAAAAAAASANATASASPSTSTTASSTTTTATTTTTSTTSTNSTTTATTPSTKDTTTDDEDDEFDTSTTTSTSTPPEPLFQHTNGRTQQHLKQQQNSNANISTTTLLSNKLNNLTIHDNSDDLDTEYA